MARRIALEIVLIVGLTVALAWIILGVFSVAGAADPVSAFVDQTPRVLFGVLGIALGLFAVGVVIGAIAQRRRTPRARIVSHAVSLVVALTINVALLALVTVAASGGGGDSWGMLVLAIAGAAGAALLVAGLTAILLVELVFLRPKTGDVARLDPENGLS
ncbi:hypothetical protein [Microcella sp.]|uniref:hypothetical protein n=1 Tax=Microcella sp. TaxID=1913979 RepID=UPI00299F7FD2|nr:hypothetical protein [Microcella sp.]MDX2026065.1 hypothetical protein [Microcella sp.]